MKLKGPIFLMQPIPYFGENLKGNWIVEPKIDGWRLQIIKYSNGKIEYWGRRLEKKTKLDKTSELFGQIFATNSPGNAFRL